MQVSTKQTLKIFLPLAFIFILPTVVAIWLYGTHSQLGKHRVNHGQLIRPAQLSDPIFNKPLRGKWFLVTAYSSQCLQDCKAILARVNNVLEIFPQERERLKAIVIADAKSWQKLPKLVQARFERNNVSTKNLQKLLHYAAHKRSTPDAVLYIVDPRGFLMMRYQLPFRTQDVYVDLKRLLKYSHIG